MSTEEKSILRFMLRAFLVVGAAALPLVAWYLWADPYKVLRHYECYLPDPVGNPVRVGINKGMVTFANYLDRRAEGRTYNAFIFGSSVSCLYDADEWAALADSTGGAHPYHFDSSGETLLSLADKVEYLSSHNQPVDYALVVLDPLIMANDNASGPALVSAPQLHKSLRERISYHYTFFRAATNADFFKSWIPFKLTGRRYANGRNLVFEPQPIVYDPVTNQETLPQWDSLIVNHPEQFYGEYPLDAWPDKATEIAPVLTAPKADALRRVASVFDRLHTDYHIIIGPNRRRETLNSADLRLMQQIFGSERVHDFSASMNSGLECDTLLYDNVHYRRPFASRLMRLVYQRVLR